MNHVGKIHDNERWSGRQIRNAYQTALALVEFDAQGGSYGPVLDQNTEVRLKVEHIMALSTAYLGFMEHLSKVRDKDDERWAKIQQIRARKGTSTMEDASRTFKHAACKYLGPNHRKHPERFVDTKFALDCIIFTPRRTVPAAGHSHCPSTCIASGTYLGMQASSWSLGDGGF